MAELVDGTTSVPTALWRELVNAEGQPINIYTKAPLAPGEPAFYTLPVFQAASSQQ